MTEILINEDNFKVTVETIGNTIDKIINDGKTAKVKITKSTRSLPQNALLHMWVNEISAHLVGHGREYCTDKWVKKALKATFLGSEPVESVDVLTGKVITTEEIRHSSDLDKGEMTFFLDRIQAWALDIDLILTAPLSSEYQELINRQCD